MPIINAFSGASVRGYGFTSGAGKKILLSATPGPSATVTTYSGYIVFKFTSSGTLNVGDGGSATADVLLVGGGSSGEAGILRPSGSNPTYSGAGGNGGKTIAIPESTITGSSPIPVVVGGTGSNSSFGPLSSSSGTASGSGGARREILPIYSGSGSNPGSNGLSNDYLTGSNQNWAGGGGGGALVAGQNYGSASGGAGGLAGGGNGGPGNTNYVPVEAYPGSAGSANTGGGGGGGAATFHYNGPGPQKGNGASGGSGIVIVRFPDSKFTTV